MKGYKLTLGQKQAIENTSFAKGQFYNPVQDINGDWFIFEKEMSNLIINNAFKNATLTDYVAPATTAL